MLLKRFIFLPFFFAFILGCGETKDSFYPNLDAAKKAGAIERGWIPDIIPESSKEIYERHNLDTNRVWVRFKFDRGDIKRLINRVEELTPAEITNIKFVSPGRINWWPKKLDKDSFSTKGPQSGLKIYKYNRVLEYSDNRQKRVLSCFVIDWDSNIAYYWQTDS
jgi:hypothetical protein